RVMPQHEGPPPTELGAALHGHHQLYAVIMGVRPSLAWADDSSEGTSSMFSAPLGRARPGPALTPPTPDRAAVLAGRGAGGASRTLRDRDRPGPPGVSP